jgi:hypothetical protein
MRCREACVLSALSPFECTNKTGVYATFSPFNLLDLDCSAGQETGLPPTYTLPNNFAALVIASLFSLCLSLSCNAAHAEKSGVQGGGHLYALWSHRAGCLSLPPQEEFPKADQARLFGV